MNSISSKNKKINNKVISIVSIIIIFFSISQANLTLGEEAYFGNTPIILSQLLLISIIYNNRSKLCPEYRSVHMKTINTYLNWSYLLIIISAFNCHNYIEYRLLSIGAISVLLPILCWLFYNPVYTQQILSAWYKYAWIPFVLLFIYKVGFTQFYLQPILILILLFPLFEKKTIIPILLFGFLFATIDVEDQRAPFIKAFVAFCGGIGIYFRNIISQKVVRIVHIFCYLCSIFLFVYIFSDFFSIMIKGESAYDYVNANNDRDMIDKDTRSLLYVDVLNSAINNNYVIWGRTPGRGFDIEYSRKLFSYSDDDDFYRDERIKNEMVLSNIFTWEGIIGLILYSLIYFKASSLAIYKSRNKIIPYIGCFVAWRWSWGWVEDVNNFLITDIDLWVCIAICYSSYFRNLTDEEFKLWSRGLLSLKYRRIYSKSCSNIIK